MSIFRNPRVCLWVGRLVPGVTWSLWLVAILVPGFGPSESIGMELLFLLWAVSLTAHMAWVYFVLPGLLFHGEYRISGLQLGYFLFTGVTAGIGPVVWYFLRVDRALRQMTASQKNTRAGKAHRRTSRRTRQPPLALRLRGSLGCQHRRRVTSRR
jgi:hypothetical protein